MSLKSLRNDALGFHKVPQPKEGYTRKDLVAFMGQHGIMSPAVGSGSGAKGAIILKDLEEAVNKWQLEQLTTGQHLKEVDDKKKQAAADKAAAEKAAEEQVNHEAQVMAFLVQQLEGIGLGADAKVVVEVSGAGSLDEQ